MSVEFEEQQNISSSLRYNRDNNSWLVTACIKYNLAKDSKGAENFLLAISISFFLLTGGIIFSVYLKDLIFKSQMSPEMREALDKEMLNHTVVQNEGQ